MSFIYFGFKYILKNVSSDNLLIIFAERLNSLNSYTAKYSNDLICGWVRLTCYFVLGLLGMGDKSKRIKWGQHVVRIGEMRND